MNMTTSILQVEALSKRFDNHVVLNALSFELSAGVHLLRGENGAGKSTLLNVIAGAVPHDSGHIRIAGHDLGTSGLAAKSHLGWLPDKPELYGFLRGRELLQIVAAAKKVNSADDVNRRLTALRIDHLIDRRFDEMSLGMQRKFMIVAALVGAPSLLLLDEPTNALDVDAVATLTEMIRDISQSASVLISSHETLEGIAITSTLRLAKGILVNTSAGDRES
jgi:ABC-2 type transport system ATP-binding protein